MELEQANWLASEGREYLDSGDQSKLQLSTWQLSLLREQVELRRRSSIRFPEPARWLWTPRSLAQASDWWCARFKASLFPTQVNVVDGCCGAGVDLVALAMRGAAIGIDRDPSLVAFANANLAMHGLPKSAKTGDLPQDFLIQDANDSRWLHLDPDRRVTDSVDRRLRSSDDFSPSLTESLQMLKRAAGAVLKLAPASIIESELESALQSECGLARCWLGNLGECRQQLLLTGELTKAAFRASENASTSQSNLRSAVLCEPQTVPIAISGPFQDTCTGVVTPRRFIYDCHSVLHASQLQLVWAESVSGVPLGTSQGYFTSDVAMSSPWAQCFEVVEVLPWDQRRVKRWLREHRIGEVEVKKRLLQLDANEYQRQLRGAGDQKITLLITRLGERVRAIVARRL